MMVTTSQVWILHLLVVVVVVLLAGRVSADSLALFPQQTETRQVQSLDGVWNFRLTQASQNGFTEKWFEKSLDLLDADYERMPVPSSYNDITEKREVRDFVGWAWYDRHFFVPKSWSEGKILLRFGSVNYMAQVYVNGKSALNHTGGHLPFEADVSTLLQLGAENHISVAINNELSAHTLPSGYVTVRNDTRKKGATYTETTSNFDFFNYAGIHRSVFLSLVPTTRIVDLTVVTNTLADFTTGTIKYEVKTNAADPTKLTFDIQLLDREGVSVAKAATGSGDIQVAKAKLWWPFATAGQQEPGYLYTLAIKVSEAGGQLVDSFYQKVGIRQVVVVKNDLLLNGKPIYLRGFGKHEEQDIRGRSLDQATVLKDFNLLKWVGANSFRTSHYPYSEAIMDEADAQGFIVIDEVPAVGVHDFPDDILAQHLTTVREIVERDKNRPSVFMWSMANEPSSEKPEAGPYFEKVAAEFRKLDPASRPLTGAMAGDYPKEYMAPSLDVLMVNRYWGWYQVGGYPQVVQGPLVSDFAEWNKKFQKPIMISEYGADTISGLHMEPTYVWSEDYQVELLTEFHKAFDTMKAQDYFIGEHIWNFADFMTGQGINRVGGNRKGVFTRDRQPKTAARLLRCRYWKLSGDPTNLNREGFSLCPDIVY